MSDSAVLVVGFPYFYYDECENDDEEKCCAPMCEGSECCDSVARRKGYLDGSAVNKYAGRYGGGPIKKYGAGYENHEFAAPSGIVGICVDSTWNDAISLKENQQKIQQAKLAIREVLGQHGEPEVWFIGQQT
jgi:hypothetical protein